MPPRDNRIECRFCGEPRKPWLKCKCIEAKAKREEKKPISDTATSHSLCGNMSTLTTILSVRK